MGLLLPFLTFATAAPVWITSQDGAGLMVAWNKPHAAPLEFVVETRAGEKAYALDRAAGTMIIATPAPPYRIGYRVGQSDMAVLAASGVFPQPPPQPRLAALATPVTPRHLKTALRRGKKDVDLFIKVNPSGKVMGTSSPYYPDLARRQLASLASDIAIRQWRFKSVKHQAYRDGRVHLSFRANGTTLQPFLD